MNGLVFGTHHALISRNSLLGNFHVALDSIMFYLSRLSRHAAEHAVEKPETAFFSPLNAASILLSVKFFSTRQDFLCLSFAFSLQRIFSVTSTSSPVKT